MSVSVASSKAAASAASAAADSPSSSSSSFISQVRRPEVIRFDTKRYPLRERIIAFLDAATKEDIDGGKFPAGGDLSRMHKHSHHSCSKFDTDRAGNEISKFQGKWNANRDMLGELAVGRRTAEQYSSEPASQRYREFEEVYINLLREVIGPLLCPHRGGNDDEQQREKEEEEEEEAARLYFQRAPTLRVILPSDKAAGKPHKDETYHHQPSEINFWLPISYGVGGNNSLWAESSPGKGDFKPIDLEYGFIFKGYLNQCMHFAVPNDTDRTRVSLDFRALTDFTGGHDPTFHAGIKGRKADAKACFQTKFDVGGFYDIMKIILPPLK